jgi:hypothetical protein
MRTTTKIRIRFSPRHQTQTYDHMIVHIIIVYDHIRQRNSRAWKLALIIMSVIVLFNESSSRFFRLESMCFSIMRSSRSNCFSLS